MGGVVVRAQGGLPWVSALFQGLKPAVVAIVILAMIKIAKKSLVTNYHYIIALLSFIAIYFYNISFPLIILGTIVFALVHHKWINKSNHQSNQNSAINQDEKGYYLTTSSVIPHAGFQLKRLVSQIALFAILWVAPLLLFYSLSSNFSFWQQLSLFFTQAAFVTFGGAYAVLPYVAQQAVENFQWLSSAQMIDGLAGMG